MERRYWDPERETMPLARLDRWRWEGIQRQLAYVYERSPYYRSILAAAGVHPEQIRTPDEFRKQVPFIRKQEIIANQAQDPPYGTLLAAQPEELAHLFWSPGPEAIPFTPADWDHLGNLGACIFWGAGARPGDRVNITCTYHWVLAGMMMDKAFRHLGCVTTPGGAGMTQMHLDVMRLLRTNVIFAFPTFLEEIARAAQAAGLDPARDLHLRLALIAGEMQSESARRAMTEAFGGMAIREFYGTAECPFVAGQCEHGTGMHVSPYYWVEVLDPQTGAPVAPGERGEICITDFHKQALPILRYRTGDITAGLDFTPCPCGRTTPRLGRILGRVGDIPRVKGLFIVPKEVAEVLSRHPELGRFQLIVDRPDNQDRLTVKVEAPAEARGEGLRTTLVQELKAKIRITAEIAYASPGELAADAPVILDRRKLD